MLTMVSWESGQAGYRAVHYLPVIKIDQPTLVRVGPQMCLAVAIDWGDEARQYLVLDNGTRVPAVETVLRNLVGDDVWFAAPEAEAWNLIICLLCAIDLCVTGLTAKGWPETTAIRVQSTLPGVLTLGKCFRRAHQPEIPVTFWQRDPDGTLRSVDSLD